MGAWVWLAAFLASVLARQNRAKLIAARSSHDFAICEPSDP